jgi:NADPH:quinone reductase-like Zn-dependent oxidoreductase
MKAIVYTKYGSPDVLKLKEVNKPVPEDNEVLIKIVASTVNRTDCATIRAKPFFMRIATGLSSQKNKFRELNLQEKLKRSVKVYCL